MQRLLLSLMTRGHYNGAGKDMLELALMHQFIP